MGLSAKSRWRLRTRAVTFSPPRATRSSAFRYSSNSSGVCSCSSRAVPSGSTGTTFSSSSQLKRSSAGRSSKVVPFTFRRYSSVSSSARSLSMTTGERSSSGVKDQTDLRVTIWPFVPRIAKAISSVLFSLTPSHRPMNLLSCGNSLMGFK